MESGCAATTARLLNATVLKVTPLYCKATEQLVTFVPALTPAAAVASMVKVKVSVALALAW